jgi:hypothetical protein
MAATMRWMDRRKVTGALMLGVVAGVIASLAERVDAALTGGRFTPLGYVNTYMWVLVSCMLFGPLLGPIITTEVQAFIGLVTYANPLSWLWPIVNLVFAVTAGLVYIGIERFHPHAKLITRIVLVSVSLAVLDIPMVYVVVVLVLGLPFIVYLASLPIYVVLQLVPTTFLAYGVIKAIMRTGILGFGK